MVLLFLAAAVLPFPAAAPRSLARFGCKPSLCAAAVTAFSRAGSGFFPFRRALQARLQSNLADGEIGAGVPREGSEIIFLGTGTSEGIPRVSCLTNPLKKCQVCAKAAEPGNKNKRLNTSILIRSSTSAGKFNILVDAGKFFYHSALRWFPMFGVREIDAVIITHSHADAIGGLDDLRDWTNNVQPCIPIYTAKRDFEVMKKTHYYLVDSSVIIPGAAVTELQFNIIKEEPFIVHNLELMVRTTRNHWINEKYRASWSFHAGERVLTVTPLPVWHGQGYRSLGFRFGNVCYISDVSDIPEDTYPLLKDCEVLIMDALRPDRSSSTHFGLPRALEEVRKIQPKRTLFTGMMHLMDHDKVNGDLAKLKETEGLDVQLSYDGLCIPGRVPGLSESCTIRYKSAMPAGVVTRKER